MQYYDIRRHDEDYIENRVFIDDFQSQYDPISFQLYTHLLRSAATHVSRYREHIIARGELVSTQAELAQILGRTQHEIRRAIDTLKNGKHLKTRRIEGKTCYRILTYDEATYSPLRENKNPQQIAPDDEILNRFNVPWWSRK